MAGPTGANYPSSGTIQYAPLLFSAKVMRLFTEMCVANEICNNDYEGEIKNKGDQVQVRVAPTYMNVGTYAPGTPIVYEVPGEDARTLNIDQSKYVAFSLDDVDKVQSDLQLMNIFAERAAISAKIDTDIAILSYAAGKAFAGPRTGIDGNPINAASSGNKGATAGVVSASYNLGASGAAITITKDNATDKIVDLGTVLSEHNVPDENRWVVIPNWYANFLKKSDLKAANITGDGKAVLRTGLIGEIDSFRVYKSNNVATTSDTGLKYHVLAGVKDAMTFASQINKSESVRSQDQFEDLWRLLLLYGREVIQPEALAELYCAPA
jgi:hypothetical protein